MRLPKNYTLEEVAQAARLSMPTLYRYVSSGKLTAVKYGKAWRVSEAEFNRFMEEGPRKVPKDPAGQP